MFINVRFITTMGKFIYGMFFRCRGYTSGICINAPECRNPGYIWKCKCWGKEKDVETLGECDAWEEYQKKEVMARKLEHLAKTITHGSMSIRWKFCSVALSYLFHTMCLRLYADSMLTQNSWRSGRWYESRHEKTCLCHRRTTKAQISLRICAVW